MRNGPHTTLAEGSAGHFCEEKSLHRQETAILTQLTTTKLECLVEYSQELQEKELPDPVFFPRWTYSGWGGGSQEVSIGNAQIFSCISSLQFVGKA